MNISNIFKSLVDFAHFEEQPTNPENDENLAEVFRQSLASFLSINADDSKTGIATKTNQNYSDFEVVDEIPLNTLKPFVSGLVNSGNWEIPESLESSLPLWANSTQASFEKNSLSKNKELNFNRFGLLDELNIKQIEFGVAFPTDEIVQLGDSEIELIDDIVSKFSKNLNIRKTDEVKLFQSNPESNVFDISKLKNHFATELYDFEALDKSDSKFKVEASETSSIINSILKSQEEPSNITFENPKSDLALVRDIFEGDLSKQLTADKKIELLNSIAKPSEVVMNMLKSEFLKQSKSQSVLETINQKYIPSNSTEPLVLSSVQETIEDSKLDVSKSNDIIEVELSKQLPTEKKLELLNTISKPSEVVMNMLKSEFRKLSQSGATNSVTTENLNTGDLKESYFLSGDDKKVATGYEHSSDGELSPDGESQDINIYDKKLINAKESQSNADTNISNLMNMNTSDIDRTESVKSNNINVVRNARFDEIFKTSIKMSKSVAQGEINVTRMHLSPEWLGTVFVEVKQGENGASIKFGSENESTLEMLESRIASLKEALKQEGVKLDDIRMEYRGQDSQMSEKFNKQQDNDGKRNKREDILEAFADLSKLTKK